jgi:hypothetical protein
MRVIAGAIIALAAASGWAVQDEPTYAVTVGVGDV